MKAAMKIDAIVPFWITLSAGLAKDIATMRRLWGLPTSLFDHILIVTHLPEYAWLLVYHNLSSSH
jgi:hypothetical protein